MIKFALLGAGRIGKSHATAIAHNMDAKLVAVYDPIDQAAENIANLYDCDILSLDEIAASDKIEAVAICTPTNTHADLIEVFARAGKAIFCEKPIDLDVDRVKACLKVVSDTNSKLMIGFNRRFDPHFKALRDDIDRGKIGEVEQVIITSRDPDLPPFDYVSVSGGLFRDMTIHDFDMARFMLGEEIESVYATGSVLVDKKIDQYDDFDSAMVIMRTKTGKLAHINNSRRASYGYDQRVEVHGALGMIRANNPRPLTNELANGKGYTGQPLHDFFMTRYMDAYSAEIASFISMLTADEDLSPSGQDGFMALLLAEAANISVREKREVKLEELT